MAKSESRSNTYDELFFVHVFYSSAPASLSTVFSIVFTSARASSRTNMRFSSLMLLPCTTARYSPYAEFSGESFVDDDGDALLLALLVPLLLELSLGPSLERASERAPTAARVGAVKAAHIQSESIAFTPAPQALKRVMLTGRSMSAT